MTEITRWSATETAKRIRAKEVSVSEVTAAHIAQMQAVNPAINAITHEVSEALDVARDMDAQGVPDDAGPLWGVPVTIKVNIDMAGYPNTNGVPAFKDMIAAEDSPVTANLKKAGAVTIGRTNTPEFSMRWCTSNPLHGVSLNPWNPEITPGGSSGAAAAAVVSGIGAIAHGNDLGGSLRYPAYCCGVATIRPSFGRVPGLNPSAPTERPPLTQTMSVNGPIARTIADVRLGLKAMSMRDTRDPFQVMADDSGRNRTSEITIGIAANLFSTDADDAVQSAIETARSAARAAGFKTRDITPPDADDCARIWGELLFTDMHYLMRDLIEEHCSPEMSTLMQAYSDRYTLLDVEGLLRTMQQRIALQRAWSVMFDEVDVLMMPTSGLSQQRYVTHHRI